MPGSDGGFCFDSDFRAEIENGLEFFRDRGHTMVMATPKKGSKPKPTKKTKPALKKS